MSLNFFQIMILHEDTFFCISHLVQKMMATWQFIIMLSTYFYYDNIYSNNIYLNVINTHLYHYYSREG